MGELLDLRAGSAQARHDPVHTLAVIVADGHAPHSHDTTEELVCPS
jgi:hypothetical protein